MRKFTFRLDSLLKIYLNREEELKKEVKVWTIKLQKVREELLCLTETQLQALRKLVESQQGTISVHQLILNHDFCQTLKIDIEKKQAEVVEKERILDKKRSDLLEASKQRKMLEKLREKKHTSFMAEELKNMQNELDELAKNSLITY